MFKFDLLEGEEPIAIYRQTEMALTKPVLIIFVLIYCPWYFLLEYEMASDYLRLLFFWTMLVFLYGLNKYLLWLLNCSIVTNRRIVVVKYQNLLNKTVLESPLGKISNVSFSSKGWATLFGYGDVSLQAEGLAEPLIIKNVTKPQEVKNFIWGLLARLHKK